MLYSLEREVCITTYLTLIHLLLARLKNITEWIQPGTYTVCNYVLNIYMTEYFKSIDCLVLQYFAFLTSIEHRCCLVSSQNFVLQ